MPQASFHAANRDRLIYKLLSIFDRLRRSSPTRLATKRCAIFPNSNSVEDGSLYLTQIGRLNKWVSFRCPGMCGKIIRLRLSASETPHWTVTTDWLGRITISPSVRQTTSCRCHFWIRRNCIKWCADTPEFRCSNSKPGLKPISRD